MTKSKTGRRVSLVLALMMVLSMLMPVSALAGTDDIGGHWAEEVINEWLGDGLAGGYGDGTFRPNQPVTRAEFMAFVNRAFGFEEEADHSFTDVPEDAWYATVVRQAVAAGYIAGYPDGTFRPNNPITRQEAAVIIAVLSGLEEDPEGADGFADQGSIPTWSRGFVGAVAGAGLMVGYPDGTFGPVIQITRSEGLVGLNNAKNFEPAVDEEDEEEEEEEEEPWTGGGGGGGGGVTPADTPITVSNKAIRVDGDMVTLDTFNTTAYSSSTRVSEIRFTTNAPNPILKITEYQGETNTVPDDFTKSFSSTTVTLTFGEMFGDSTKSDISMGALRLAFGDSVTVKGTLRTATSGYTTLNKNLGINLAGTGTPASYSTDWAEMTVDGDTIVGTLTVLPDTKLVDIGLSDFFTGVIGALPSHVSINEGTKTAVLASNLSPIADEIVAYVDAEVRAVSSIQEITLGDMEGKVIAFWRDGSAQKYYIDIVPPVG